jgi:hypothetical protein
LGWGGWKFEGCEKKWWGGGENEGKSETKNKTKKQKNKTKKKFEKHTSSTEKLTY